MGNLIRAVVLACSLLAAGLAQAHNERISPDLVRELVAKGELLPLDEILRRNERELVGRILEIELERTSTGYVYEIKVLRPDGRKIELKIDGRTGVIIPRRR